MFSRPAEITITGYTPAGPRAHWYPKLSSDRVELSASAPALALRPPWGKSRLTQQNKSLQRMFFSNRAGKVF